MVKPQLLKRCYHFAKRHTLTSRLLQSIDRIQPRKLDAWSYPIYVRRVSNHWVKDAYEREIRDAFLRVVDARACVSLYDIGANVGIFTLDFLSAAPHASVMAFEPNPAVCSCLKMTKERNQLDTLSIHEVALTDYTGVATLTFDPLSPALGGIHPIQDGKFNHEIRYNGLSKTCAVEALTLDHFLTGDHPPPDIIKIDAEGEEWRILKGGKRLLKEHQPILLFECSHAHHELTALLRELGYGIYDLNLKRAEVGGMSFGFSLGASPLRLSF